jgi:hypothetical protein
MGFRLRFSRENQSIDLWFSWNGGFGHRPMISSPKLYNLAIKHGVLENYSSCSLEILVPIANSSQKNQEDLSAS